MSKIIIAVEFLAGTDIRDAVTEAKEKAKQWGVCYVNFNFNTVRFSIGSTADIDSAIEKFHEEIKDSSSLKFVCER